MPNIPGLRSPYVKVGRIVYFARMLDKIRLHAAGRLPPEWVANLGDTSMPNFFDARCCRFLGLAYADLRARVLAGGSDADHLAWAEAHGRPHTDEECIVWNAFMTKLGWRDDRTALVRQRIVEYGCADRAASIDSMFDLLDVDEGRDPAASRAANP